MENESLEELGWNDFFESAYKSLKASGNIPARVIAEHRERYVVMSSQGELEAVVSGKFKHDVKETYNFPKTGDWVAVEILPGEKKGIIREILPRQTRLVRKAVGKKFFEQVIASNIDYLFITQSLDSDFSVRRTERYAAACVEGGIIPVLLLTKSDLCPNAAEKKEEADINMPSLRSIVMSIKTGEGLDELKGMLETGKTYAFAGSSGVGKSSLINALAGEALLYSTPVREKDQKGRHTTVAREIITVKPGWLLLDTPGMREMAPWDAEDGVNLSFADVEEIIIKCRFSDCTHTSEKDCAVQAAIKEGALDEKRLLSYIKLQKEQEYLAMKKNKAAAVLEKQKWKTISKNQRNLNEKRAQRRFED